MYTTPQEQSEKTMPDLLQEPPCSETVPPEPQTLTEPTETLAGLSARLAALEARLARKRPIGDGRYVPRMTRLDRCPYGWRPHPRDPAQLVQDWNEQEVIRYMFDAANRRGLGPRPLCHYLDARGLRRRGKKRWADGGHTLVAAILERASRPLGR